MSEISQTAPVTDEELDQMIWKLERDGMTPKQLSLMRELREVRRAKGEPVAQIEVISGVLINERWMHSSLPNGWHDLYASRLSGNSEQLEPVSNRDELKKGLAAIRNSGIAIDGEKILAERDVLNSPATPDGWVMVPVEPTPEMRDAYHNAQEEYESVDGLWSPDHQWKAMIAAAPKEVG